MTECIAVVGANGFIGSRLLAAFHAAGHRTHALSRRPPEIATEWTSMGDITPGPELATALESATCVVWAAGASTPASSALRPGSELELNLLPIIRFLEQAPMKHPLRVVYFSTGGAIYGDVSGLASESTVLEPKSYYSAGKAAAESFLSAWSHLGQHEVTILRPSNVYGPGQAYRPGFGIVPTAFHAIRTSEPVSVRGDGEAVRDYLYIDDLADLCLRVLAKPAQPGCRTFNASSAVGTSLNSLLSIITETTGSIVPRTWQPATPFDVRRIVPDNAAARAAFGWQPRIHLHEGILRAWREFQ
ncbi:NAD-dependent epimerase/dehydratase family protein [Luteibacter aegosomaticola]|uniref:NAD-dependent epimerase/dehydratase family protein n=1 Tax=Luteibacter aegosomaticola TaxID=2911538 RepID=UPI001FF97BBD|nr:NAD-dependent epimerase/dehydratase family protein [Luteibacter aegosomaticola]UPG91439.1 NAD-dependent epimerase/dehydratase family protein [Luteibacter aegosomaticola]